MQYVCRRQLTAGGMTYYPGMIIPDGVILPVRGEKLLKCGYLSKLEEEQWTVPGNTSRKNTRVNKEEQSTVPKKQSVEEKKGADT